MSISGDDRPVDELKREDWVRRTLESAASRIESLAGNDVYQAAWRRAAKLIREMKP